VLIIGETTPAGKVHVLDAPPVVVVANPSPMTDLELRSGGDETDVLRSEKNIPSFRRKFAGAISMTPNSFVTTETVGLLVESMPMALNFFFSRG
jgi:hypothetical protein